MTIAAILAGLVALALRRADASAVVIVVGVGLIGLVTPMRAPASPRRSVVWPLTLGIAAVALVAVGSPRLVTVAHGALAADVIAAVGEEAFFRRLVHGWLLRWGAAVAIGVGAVTFAMVHVPMYGWKVVPIDAAAGALFAWQRQASGTWIVPAVTHAAANWAARW